MYTYKLHSVTYTPVNQRCPFETQDVLTLQNWDVLTLQNCIELYRIRQASCHALIKNKGELHKSSVKKGLHF